MNAETRSRLLNLCYAFDGLAEQLQARSCRDATLLEAVQRLRRSVEAVRQLLAET